MSEAARQSAAAATTTTQEASFFDQVIGSTRTDSEQEKVKVRSAVEEFVRQIAKPGQVISPDVMANIKFWIAEIDKKLTQQLNEVMHAQEFQKLEGTWRGLKYLMDQSEISEKLKIRVLNVRKDELLKDLERASEFDQSGLWQKVYEDEYGTLGGKPYGMLVGDYEFGRKAEDVNLLKHISKVAASAHAPFVSNASPALFGFERFTEMPNPADLSRRFESDAYAPWKSFRDSEDSRYMALALPRVLSRLPYGDEFKKVEEFNYEEAVDGTNHDKYLWMGAAWAYASRITAAAANYGWMARSRGVEGGGKVEGLPTHTFPTDDGGVAMKCPTEIAISDRRELELSNLGFLPLLHSKGSDWAVFMGAQSCQKPKDYFDPEARANAKLSAKFNFMLCVARFSHYLKVMARDKIGEFMELKDCEVWLNTWINQYVHPDPANAGPAAKAAAPLAEARVEVRAKPGEPGNYEAIAYIRPHFQLEGLSASIRMVSKIPEKK